MDSFYIGNLVRCLQKQGVTLDLPADERGDFLSARWLRNEAGHVDLLHFHWTHYHYTANTWRRSFLELAKFIGKIGLARRLGYGIVWTMHNYMPHERTYPLLHYAERLLLARLAHAIIVHCEHGRMLVRAKLWRRNSVFAVPLGNFGPYLAAGPSRQIAREQLGISDDLRVLLHFGLIRPYKQVPQLIRAFSELRDPELRLMIVGASPSQALSAEIIALADQDPRVVLEMSFVSDGQLAVYLRAADIAVFPYRDILGSGSVMLALSAGLPVVAPAAGCLSELVTSSCGTLYTAGPGAVAKALRMSTCRDDLDSRRQAAVARANQFPWDTMVQRTSQVYAKVLGGDSCY